MLLDRFRGYDRRLAAADALSEVARLDFDCGDRPALLPFSPVSRGQPVSSADVRPTARAQHACCAGLRPRDAADDRRRAARGPAVVAHLHWLNVVMQSAGSESEARGLLRAFTDDLAGD